MQTRIAAGWPALELDRIWLVGELIWRRACVEGRAVPIAGAIDLEAEFARRRGRRTDRAIAFDAKELAEAIDDVLVRTTTARASSPVGVVATRLGLRPWEVDALVLAVAPQLDPLLLELFAALRGGPRRGVDLALVGELFGASPRSRGALLDVLDPERPLLRWQLVEAGRSDAPIVQRVFAPTADLLRFLCAPPRDERPGATFDDLVLAGDLRERLASLAAALSGQQAPSWVVLWGRRGAGKATIAGRLAAHLGRPLVRYAPRKEDPAQATSRLRAAQRDALLREAVLYVGAVASAELDEALRGCADHPGPVIVGVEGIAAPRLAVSRPIEEIAVPVPDEPARRELWTRLVGDGVDLGSIASAYQLTPGEIAAVAAEVNVHAVSRGRRPTRHDVRAGIERQLRSELADMAWRLDVTATWEDLVLPAADVTRLQELVARRQYADQVYREWGFGRRLQYGMGMIALFSGPPGTGKSMLAGLIATTLDMEIYQVDVSQVMSKWIGETEKKLSKLFDLAERTQAVLLFDEADSLLGKRTDVNTSNDRFANTAVNFLLQRLERYTGIAVLTTNKLDALDEALQRRLSLHLRLEAPEADDRRRLWSTFLSPRVPGVDTLDLDWIAERFELTGGHIKNAAVRAAFLAAAAQRPLDMATLVRAVEAELDDLGRVVHTTTFAPRLVEADRRMYGQR